jgi:hypothetical protein
MRVPCAAQQNKLLQIFARQFDIHDIDQRQVGLARIHAALEYPDLRQVGSDDRQSCVNQRIEVGAGMVQRQLEFGQPDHGALDTAGRRIRSAGSLRSTGNAHRCRS